MNDFDTLWNDSALLMRGGRFADALEKLDRALALKPEMPEALCNRAVALASLGRFEEAIASCDKALALRPDFAEAWACRGNMLGVLGRFAQALASFDKAIAAQPGDVAAHHHRGLSLANMGRFEEAIESYDKALALQPALAGVLENRGAAQWNLGRFADALASFDKALAHAPGNADLWNNRGAALRALQRPAEAVASCDRAIALRPNFAIAHSNRGLALRDLARFQQALTSYEKAIAFDPRDPVIWNNRGVVLKDLKRFDEAFASYSRAIALKPDYAEALNNRGCLQWADMRRFEEAIADLEQALGVDYAPGELLHIRMQGADWRDYEQQRAAIDRGIRAGRRVARPFAYQAICESPADLAACSRLFARSFAAMPGPPVRPGREHAKIRIGYVSADFRAQATAYLTVGLYEMHDKARFEIVAFDNGFDDHSPIRARLEAAFDKFVDISNLSDDDAARAVRAEEIDILVNLNGYFGEPRMGIFARRPAPIQVNYLGFPATLGAPYIDYILADRVVIPEEDRRHYTEQVVYLPDSYQANDSRRPIAAQNPTRAENGLPEDAFVFCNFNQSYKLTPETFASWMRILGQVPGSVLWLLDGIPALRGNLAREAERHGVEGARIVLAPLITTDAHLARLRLADLFVDSLPYNAHTTASDALWAGVPLLTRRGAAFPGRVAASLLLAAGLPELVTQTPDEYEQLAVALARDPARLGALRQRLARDRARCALFDTDRFRRHLEAAYSTMWETWRRGETPRGFAVDAR